MTRIGIFPGSFDPLTNGHIQVIDQASQLFDVVYVLIARNTSKAPLFTLDERIQLVKASLKHYHNIEVMTLDSGLVAQFCKKQQIEWLIRGLRNSVDFEYEKNIAIANAQQHSSLKTMCLFTDVASQHISSSLVKEIAMNAGDITNMVPEPVQKALNAKYA